MNLIDKLNLPTMRKEICFSKCISLLIFTASILFFTGYAYAGTTRYVNPDSPNPGGGYTSWSSAAHDIATALNAMSGGDELIIRDGIYTGVNNMVDNNIPSGTSDEYTVVRAENDFGVVIDAEQMDGRVPFKLSSRSYIKVQGVLFKRPGDINTEQASVPVFLIRCNNVKMIRVGASECAEQAMDTTGANDSSNIFVLSRCSYVLLEECYSYGYGKYVFLVYSSDHIVLRRCIGRHDGWVTGKSDIFSAYSSHDIIYQNCIALDFDQPRHWHGQTNGVWGGFNQNGSTYNISYYGCIVKNITGSNGVTLKRHDGQIQQTDFNPAWKIDAGTDSTTLSNCLAIDVVDGILAYGAIRLNNCSFINVKKDNSTDLNWYGKGIDYVRGSSPILRNSILYACERAGVSNTNSDYNAFFANGTDHEGGSRGAHDITNINFAWSNGNPSGGLKYPVRIEAGSNLSGKGNDGSDIGATIMKRYGVSGTLYGENGYLDLTDADLWPFPNENEIRERMRAYRRWDPYDNIDPGGTGPDTYVRGDRGFCAEGQTLTKYIWESLGNRIPDDLYEKKLIITDIEIL